MVKGSKSILARLLANENITVQRGNYKTAFFDVERRVLGLPLWEDYGKDVEDLLIGHEVGHALFTPADGWHDSPKEMKVPRSFLNVVEDIRIERKVQSKYPGLVNSFKKGYKKFSDLNFFNTEGKDLTEYSLIDRLNIKSKLRDLVDISFTQEEQPYVDMAFACDTFEDVVEAAKSIYDFMREDNEDDTQSPESPGEYDEPMEEGEDEDLSSGSQMGDQESSEEPEDTGGDAQQQGTSEEDEDGEEQSSVGESDQESDSEEKEESQLPSSSGGEGDQEEMVSETDEAFRQNEGKLNKGSDGSPVPVYVAPMCRKNLGNMLISYSEVKEARMQSWEQEKSYFCNRNSSYYESAIAEEEAAFISFQDETKKITSLIAKEFEMRKAAYRTIRASTARSGSIDVNKLYSYQFQDDIFRKVTNLADAQSHGMVMVIDYSGSMIGTLEAVIKQTLNLATFCKKVNIPFEVYGFTSGDRGSSYMPHDELPTGSVDTNGTKLFHLLSSSFGKSQYEEAYKDLFMTVTSSRYKWSQVEWKGGTPLNEVLLGLKFILSDFKAKHAVQKLNLVMLTDGAAASMRTTYRDQPESLTRTDYRKYNIDFNNKVQEVDRKQVTKYLISEYSKMGINTICFYLTETTRDINDAIYQMNDFGYVDWDVVDEQRKLIRQAYRTDKLKLYKNMCGYNQYFLLKAGNKDLDTSVENLEIDPNASKAQIKKAFSKYSSSKKLNRSLATKFAQAIA
jgi:Mg-chelatase subunit ChlD